MNPIQEFIAINRFTKKHRTVLLPHEIIREIDKSSSATGLLPS